MLNDKNYPLQKALQIINFHKMKSNTLKNYFLKKINENDLTTQILSYLGELEYDLESLNNIISNFQMFYNNLFQNRKDSSLMKSNLNKQIKSMVDSLNHANEEIMFLKNENNILKAKEILTEKIQDIPKENFSQNEVENVKEKNSNKKIIINHKREKNNNMNSKRLNKTYSVMNNMRNYINYTVQNKRINKNEDIYDSYSDFDNNRVLEKLNHIIKKNSNIYKINNMNNNNNINKSNNEKLYNKIDKNINNNYNNINIKIDKNINFKKKLYE